MLHAVALEGYPAFRAEALSQDTAMLSHPCRSQGTSLNSPTVHVVADSGGLGLLGDQSIARRFQRAVSICLSLSALVTTIIEHDLPSSSQTAYMDVYPPCMGIARSKTRIECPA